MISVVIPMYNAEDTIKSCIQSVIDQTIDCYVEILVVNDGSKDQSASIVEEMIKTPYANREIKLISKINGGVSSARNAGLKAATQDWIALLDSDDIWTPQKLEVQMKTVKENQNILFLGTNFNNFKYFPLLVGGKNLYKLSSKKIIFKWWPYPSTMFFSRRLITEYGVIFNEKMRRGEDGLFLLEVLKHTGIYVLNQSTVFAGNGKRTFGDSGLSANLPKMFEGEIQILKTALKDKQVGLFSYFFFYLWLSAKYLRRQLIVRFF